MNLIGPHPEAAQPPTDPAAGASVAPDPPTAPDRAAAVHLLSRASVLVVGDVMLDRYVYGQVTRISPEAPVPILSVDREVAYPGGAGNVVRNLTALGAAVALVSVVGDDQAGADLTGLVGGQPGVEPWLLVQGGRTTTMKTRLVAAGQHLLRTDREVTTPINPRLAERMISIATDAMAATAVIVLSDYRKGLLAGDVPARLIAAAHTAGRKVIVDTKDPDHARYAGADIIIPNRRDLSEATGLPVEDEAQVIAAAHALRTRHGFGAVLVTEGSFGMTLVDAATATHFAAEAGDVYDVSGAGDTVIAVLALAMACGAEIESAVHVANVAAGIVVSKAGTVPIQRDELLGALTPEIALHMDDKVLPLEHLLRRVAGWRAAGQRVVFTNGCFDLLHIGHITLLEKARSKGDRLIVGLNSDSSVRRVKGAPRPLVGEQERAKILAALSAVDAVVLFHESTPLKLIEAIRPDVLVKGGDYTEENVVGAREVRAWGGRVELIPLVEGVSTTRLIAKSVAAVSTARSTSAVAV